MVDSNDQKAEVSQSTRKVADAIAMGLINGRSVEDIAGELVKQGWKQADAVAFVQKIDEVRKQAQLRHAADSQIRRGLKIHMIMGLIWIAIGIMILMNVTPQRDYSPMGIAAIALGVIEVGWAAKKR